MTNSLLYLYAITAPRPGAALPAGVRLLQEGDLAAAVMDVPAAVFAPDALRGHLHDAQWVATAAMQHDVVLHALLAGGAVLPCAFCTVYADETALRSMLHASAHELTRALATVAGAAEWGVKLFCDQAALQRWAEEQPALAAQRAAVAQASSGAAYLLRKQWERRVNELADAAGTSALRRVHAALSEHARESVLAPLPSQRDELMLKASYLVDDAGSAAFGAQCTVLAEQVREQGLRLELTGPWPAYSFARLPVAETERGNP